MKLNLKMLAVAAMLVAAPLHADAQFFKKLGKALENAGKSVVNSALGATSGETTKTEADGTKLTNNLSGFTVEYKGVTWREDFCGVDLLITNNGSKTTRVECFEKLNTVDANGNSVASRTVLASRWTTLNNGDYDFEPGVPVRVIYALFDLPEKGTKISLMQIRTTTGYDKKNYIELRNVTIPPKPVTPFKGDWRTGNDSYGGKLELDLYGKTVESPVGDKCYGVFYMQMNSGMRFDDCEIISCTPNGNKATVKFKGGRDFNTYSCVLTYNPSNKKITVSNVELVAYSDGSSEGYSECYVYEGLVFSKE